MIAVEKEAWGQALADFAPTIPRPRAIVAVSGHFEEPSPVRVTASQGPETIHDFSGFPKELYKIRYDAPGDPELAARVKNLLGKSGIAAELDSQRGLDHGVWVPLRFLFPEADVPVVEVSQASRRTPQDALKVGAALSPLRDDGVLLLGTGGIVHNLRLIDFAEGPAADWALAFDAWIAERLDAMDVASIANYRHAAPNAGLAVPTPEHFDPIFVVLGSAVPGESVRTIHQGFRYGTLSMRSFAIA